MRFGIVGAPADHADAAILEIDGDAAGLLIRQRGMISRVARVSADEAGFHRIARILAERGGAPHGLVLRLPQAAVLQKRLSLPLAARRHLEGLLGFEMDRETPYARDEVHWRYALRRQDAAHGRIEVDLAVVPRSFVDPLVEAARRAGLDPAGVEVATAPNETVLIRLGAGQRWQRLRAQRPLVAMAAAACVLAVIAVATPFIRQQRAIAAADAEIQSLTPQATEAAALRQSIDHLASTFEYLKQERNRTGSALSALAAATRAVSDDSYLTGLTLHEGRLVMTGLSPSAAQLVGSLAQSADFREPAFDAPVVQNESDGLETFTISVSLKPAGSS